MATYLPTPGTLPSGWCPSTWQTVLNQFAALLPIVINGEDEVIIQADTPGVDDRGKVWIKTLDVAPWVDSIRIWVAEIPPSGDWRPIPGQPVYFVDTGAADAMVITTGESMNSELFLTGRIFMVKANNTNTGPVTLTVDSIAAKGVKKQNNVDMEAGDFVAGQILLLAFDPVSNVFEVVNTLAPEPVVLPPQTPETAVNMSATDVPVPGPLGETVAHGLPGTPSWIRITYVPSGSGVEIDGDSIFLKNGTSGDSFGPGFGVTATNTHINIWRRRAFAVMGASLVYAGSSVSPTDNSVGITVGVGDVIRVRARYDIPRGITVSTQPVSQTKSAGQNASFTVAVLGDTPITYQWQRNGVNIFDGGRLSGTATATLTITGVVDGVPPGGDEANYSCVLTNTVGTVSSNTASLTVT